MWSANTECFSKLVKGQNDTWENLKASIKRRDENVSASTIYAAATVLEKCSFINGSPQNTLVPGII
jgi:myo-inositol-1-phosphate synthase